MLSGLRILIHHNSRGPLHHQSVERSWKFWIEQIFLIARLEFSLNIHVSSYDMDPDMACIGRKRFLDAGESAFRDTKRRLIENFTDLHIGAGGPGYTSKSMFESEYLNSAPQHSPASDRVVISNIDQFLRENPDPLEGEKVDLSNVDLNKLIIPNVAEGRRVNELSELYDRYVRSQGALVKYYNPEMLTYSRYIDSKDLKGKIEELDSDDEDTQVAQDEDVEMEID
ncbi:hypothetical protein KL935_004363 [Ogataea polymorpha]|nr:hypothetical protein KL935_004363 [Ogataea polymorpha]